MKSCPNCTHSLDGEFCANCGQRDVDLERPIGALVRELFRETFDIDGRAWRTLRTMFRHPGLLTSEFLAGKRRLYTPPLRLYIAVSVAFFVWAAWLASRGFLLDPGQNVDTHASGQAQFLSDALPKLMFVLLPVFAVLLKIAYHRRLYFDHLIHSLHLHSAAYIALALMLPLEEISHWLPIALQAVVFALLIGHFIISLRRVYATGWFSALVKMIAVLLTYGALLSFVIETTSNFSIISD